MDTIAFVFSGQGSQKPGMGKTLYDSLPAVKEVFDRYETILPGTKAQCFEGDLETLTRTDVAQPCIYTLSMAIAGALEQEGVTPAMAAGFSLGEISALAYAGVFSGDDGFHFVRERGRLMQEQSLLHPGSMAAVLRLTEEQVRNLCLQTGSLYPVNYNCPGQVVVAGESTALSKLDASVRPLGGRLIPLKVSGAFHSPLMDQASEWLDVILKKYRLSPARLPIYANLTAAPYPSDPKNTIVRQVNHPVLWQKTIENMIHAGATDFIEIGVGNTLCGLIGKISTQVHTMHIEDKESFDEAIKRYKRRSADA